MEFKIIEDANQKILRGLQTIYLPNFSVLLEDIYAEKILGDILKNNSLISTFGLSATFQRKFLDNVFNNVDTISLTEELERQKIPLFSLIINEYNIFCQNYNLLKSLKSAQNIKVICQKENLSSAILLAIKYNIPMSIYGKNIHLDEYKTLLDSFDLNALDKCDIKIYYQNSNSPLSPRELFEISSLISQIAENIKKCHLSPLEETILVYDIIKKRIYKDCDEDKTLARDIDKVIKGEYTVCVGYSNLFNAIQRCLGRNSKEILNESHRHQRSITYVQDDKYALDKILTFDPTWDSRKSDEDFDYSDNYSYFGLPLEISEKTLPSNFFDILTKNVPALASNYLNGDIDEDLRLEQNIETIFTLIGAIDYHQFLENINYYDYINPEQKDKLEREYKEITSKYLTDDIPPQILLRAIYNARRVEYLSGITTSIDIDKIIEGLIKRYLLIYKNKIKNNCQDKFEFYILQIIRESELRSVLESEKEKIINSLSYAQSFSEDKKHIELIKALKKRLTTMQ